MRDFLKPLSAFSLLVMVAGLVCLYLVGSLLSPAPLVIAAQVAAVALMVWARVTFGRRSFHATADPTEGGLVTTGPYRWIRHPIYTAATVIAVAGACGHPSLAAAGLALLALAGAIGRMLAEERLVVQRYPEYAEYAARTSRMVPFIF